MMIDDSSGSRVASYLGQWLDRLGIICCLDVFAIKGARVCLADRHLGVELKVDCGEAF